MSQKTMEEDGRGAAAMTNEWASADHAEAYLERADRLPHRREGEAALLEVLPTNVRRVLDLGTGDGRLLEIVRRHCPALRSVALDFSPTMLTAVRERFSDDPSVSVIEHDLVQPLPELGTFDAIVSSFAIHHLTHERKRSLYEEVLIRLAPGGLFCNLEHVASPTPRLHVAFLRAINYDPEQEDPSNRLLDLEIQLHWLREIGYGDVDCLWKWRELALLVAYRPEYDTDE